MFHRQLRIELLDKEQAQVALKLTQEKNKQPKLGLFLPQPAMNNSSSSQRDSSGENSDKQYFLPDLEGAEDHIDQIVN